METNSESWLCIKSTVLLPRRQQHVSLKGQTMLVLAPQINEMKTDANGKILVVDDSNAHLQRHLQYVLQKIPVISDLNATKRRHLHQLQGFEHDH